MKINKVTAVAIAIIAVLTVVFILIFRSIYKKLETGEAPELPQRMEAGKEEIQVYSIPENVMPTEADIEKRINMNKERAAMAKEANAAKALAREKTLPPPAAKPAGLPKKPTDAVPDKEEVKFPTYEERKAEEAKSGVVSY